MSTSPKTLPPNALPRDALEILAADHKAMLAMFRDYEQHKQSATPVDKGKEALRLCHRLSIDSTIKEEFFYSAADAVLGKKAEPLLAEIRGQAGALRGMMKTIEGTPASDPAFDAAVKELGEAARRHFDIEEKELFPALRHADFDRAGTGEKLASRKAQLSTEPAGKAEIREARRVLGG